MDKDMFVKLPSIELGAEALSGFEKALQREWLVTNGLGGYASSTILGLNTRKYHGLLVAALRPPGDRTVCLAKLDEDLIVGDEVYRLGVNEFHNELFPQGYLFLKQFSTSPFPTFAYQAPPNLTVMKTVFMPYRKNMVAAIYNLRNGSGQAAEFRVFPLMTCRHFHEVVDHLKNPLVFLQKNDKQKVELAFKAPSATLISAATAGEFVDNPNWIGGIHYREERLRGEIDTDSCYQPGYFRLTADADSEAKLAIVTVASESGEEATKTLAAEGCSTGDFEQAFNRELELRCRFLNEFYGSHEKISSSEWLSWILLAADSFVVRDRFEKNSVIAGYFWFESWGRDTFISLPGLMLVTGRFSDAKHVLLNFGHNCKHGLIPNIILDKSGQPLYNTVDGTLWFINAVFQYLKYTCDFNFVQENLWTTLKSIIESHERGTDYEIYLDSDGLVSHGSRLTWMDACIEGEAVTPREGKAVEIQALWYNALKIMQLLASTFEEKSLAEKYCSMADKAKANFNDKFWNDRDGCLVDVVEKSGLDLSLRPNQIIAVSLDFTMLSYERSRKIVELVQREFLTPCGLRTLSRSDPRYQSIYTGLMRDRDQAYHNGAVWPWLLGPFTTAFLKVAGGNPNQNPGFSLDNFFHKFFERQICEGGLGTVNEIFDGDPPHAPRGCVSQAWSVAEPLRAYVEDVLQFKPKYADMLLSSNILRPSIR